MGKNPGRLVLEPGSGRGSILVFGGSGGAARMLQGGGGGVKRKGFYCSAEELMMEDEYYDEQMLLEKKRRLTPEQVQHLEQSFDEENKLEPERKCDLAKKLGLQPRQIAIWFQNRRARWKNKQLERDFDSLKSSYDSLLADHDALLVDNQRLRSEVLLLMEKLEAKRLGDHQITQLLQLGDGVAVDATIIASPDTIVPLSSDNQSSDSSGIAVVDEGGCLPLVDNYSHYMEPEDGGSNNGGLGVQVYSSEEDGSYGDGAYVSGVFTIDNISTSYGDDVQDGEDVEAMSWWMWN